IASSPFGCADTASVQVTVAPGVQADFTHNAVPGCAPLDVDFTNNSTGNGAYFWDFGDGSTSTDASPSHTYINTGLFLNVHTVTLTISSPAGCSSTTTRQVMVYPAVDLGTVLSPDSGCGPLVRTFPAPPGIVSQEWDFGDGGTSSLAAPSHTFMNTGAADARYTVTLIGSNAFGCRDTVTTTVTVFPKPVAQFTLSDTAGCHPFTAQLDNLSTGAANFLWDYGAGPTPGNPPGPHTRTWHHPGGLNPEVFQLALVATSAHGCRDTAHARVTVYPEVVAAFTAPQQGCAPLAAAFINTRSEEHTSELQSREISYAVFCLKKKKKTI